MVEQTDQSVPGTDFAI